MVLGKILEEVQLQKEYYEYFQENGKYSML